MNSARSNQAGFIAQGWREFEETDEVEAPPPGRAPDSLPIPVSSAVVSALAFFVSSTIKPGRANNNNSARSRACRLLLRRRPGERRWLRRRLHPKHLGQHDERNAARHVVGTAHDRGVEAEGEGGQHGLQHLRQGRGGEKGLLQDSRLLLPRDTRAAMLAGNLPHLSACRSAVMHPCKSGAPLPSRSHTQACTQTMPRPSSPCRGR